MKLMPGPVLRAGRSLLDMSQEEFADHAGISIPTLRRVENDQMRSTSDYIRTVQATMMKLGVDFIDEEGDFSFGLRLRKCPR